MCELELAFNRRLQFFCGHFRSLQKWLGIFEHQKIGKRDHCGQWLFVLFISEIQHWQSWTDIIIRPIIYVYSYLSPKVLKMSQLKNDAMKCFEMVSTFCLMYCKIYNIKYICICAINVLMNQDICGNVYCVLLENGHKMCFILNN